MIFEKPSTRTRVSFDVGMRQLGGDTIMLTGDRMQLGRGETIADTARVLSRYVDAIMIRTIGARRAARAGASTPRVPVINGLTDSTHPCQLMADVMTFEEHRGADRGQDARLDRATATTWLTSLDPRRRAVRLRAQLACPEICSPAQGRAGLGAGERRQGRDRHRSRRGGRRRRLRRHRHLGLDGRCRHARDRHNCCAPYQVDDAR